MQTGETKPTIWNEVDLKAQPQQPGGRRIQRDAVCFGLAAVRQAKREIAVSISYESSIQASVLT